MKNAAVLKTLVLSTLISFQAQAWTTTQEAADRLGATQVKEISFDKNSSNLSQAQKDEFTRELADAKLKGQIDEIKILAWSDKEYPGQKHKLSKSDNLLAKRRLSNLKTFFKNELKVSSVDSYNMTERPNALQKLFNTSSAQVKTVAENTGAAPNSENTGLFDMNAQASKGVVMIFLKK
jgi:hypothetical protein